MSISQPPAEIETILRQCGFWHTAQIRGVAIDSALISALVERWRPETHTFHLSCGEATVTLEDVAMILGLPIDGYEVMGSTSHLGPDLCVQLLGVAPPREACRGQTITLAWLKETFSVLPPHAGPEDVACAARAYILRLIGCLIMPDTTHTRVHLKWLPLLADLSTVRSYSWGSACLATLYRSLCRASKADHHNVFGCLVLLQSWAWYRISNISPPMPSDVSFPLARRWRHVQVDDDTRICEHNVKVYRLLLDQLQMNQFIWMPYSRNEIIEVVPLDIWADRYIWTSHTALICFEIVEWHPSDRVQRQYGFGQQVPGDGVYIGPSHDEDLRGQGDTNWWVRHERWIGYWRERASRCQTGLVPAGNNEMSSQYFTWYQQNAAILFLSTHDLLSDPRTRSINLPTAIRAYPAVNVDIPPPSPP